VRLLGAPRKARYVRRMISAPTVTAPTLADIEAIARDVLERLPEPFRRHVEDVVIRVEDFCDAEVEQEMGLDSPFDLLGLYQGVSLGQKSVADAPQDLDRIFLYRRPILDFWCEGNDTLDHVVRHVLIHEIGHHLGFSDDDMERIEEAAD
jgi:predicted Zn-dependent protease with MMP-like domain